jgi:hypothetical protein
MLFYKDANSLFHLGSDIVPSNKAVLKSFHGDTIISIESPDGTKLLGPIEVVLLQRENLTYYPNLSTLLTENQDFLK